MRGGGTAAAGCLGEEKRAVNKRTLALLAGALVLGGSIYLGRELAAQAPAAPARAQTRIAVLNLAHVLKGYQKAMSYQADFKGFVTKFQNDEKTQLSVLESMKKELSNPALSQEERAKKEKDLRAAQRALEDYREECKTFLAHKQEEQVVTLYKEVEYTARQLALASGFEMVLHFNDAMRDTQEYYSPMNVGRKLQAGALIPLYVHPGMDISAEVLKTLNDNYRPTPAASAAPAAATPGR
jgi:outer membrane protein